MPPPHTHTLTLPNPRHLNILSHQGMSFWPLPSLLAPWHVWLGLFTQQWGRAFLTLLFVWSPPSLIPACVGVCNQARGSASPGGWPQVWYEQHGCPMSLGTKGFEGLEGQPQIQKTPASHFCFLHTFLKTCSVVILKDELSLSGWFNVTYNEVFFNLKHSTFLTLIHPCIRPTDNE